MNMTTAPEHPEAAHLEKLRSQLSNDIEAMQQKEASLREYEQRLRTLLDQAQAHSRPPQSPSQYFVASAPNMSELDAAWEKYNRAHALLEAARRGMCDDRMALKEREEHLHLREVEIARREAWVKVREVEIAALAQARTKQDAEIKARPSFSKSPFLAARNLFVRQN